MTALRILFLNHNVARSGGTFYRALDAARYLVRRGHSVTLLTISMDRKLSTTTEDIDGVRVVHTPDLFWGIGRSGWDPWDTLTRLKYVLGRDWDIVHAWDCRPAVIFPALAARFLRNGNGATLFIDWCDWWGRGGTQTERGGGWARHVYNVVETFFEESFRRFADGSTVITRALFDRAVSLRVPKETIRLLPQGCDESVEPRWTREEARAALGIASGDITFLSIGVLNTSDAALMFDAARILARTRPQARFLILGRNRATVPEDLAGSFVENIGWVNEETLEQYLAAANAVVVPLADTVSSRGRWPSKVNMFLSRGLVVVTCRVGDLPALLEREGAAFVSRPDPAELARALECAVSDSAAVARVTSAARRVARDILPWTKIVQQLEGFYFEMAAKRTA